MTLRQPSATGWPWRANMPAWTRRSLPVALAAVAVHTAAMLAVTGAISVGVYEWLGVAFLRRGWLNLDRLWIAALIAAGLILLL